MATIFGLFVWNLRITQGLKLQDVPSIEPEFQPRKMASFQEETSLSKPSLNPNPKLVEELNKLDWPKLLKRLPGLWKRTDDGLGLQCPENKVLLAVSRYSRAYQQLNLAFSSSKSACKDCPRKIACGLHRSSRKTVVCDVPSSCDNIYGLVHEEQERREALRVTPRKELLAAMDSAEIYENYPYEPNPRLSIEMDKIDWKKLIGRLPNNWERSPDGINLICPEKSELLVGIEIDARRALPYIMFNTSNTGCKGCPRKTECGIKNVSRKRVTCSLPEDSLDLVSLISQEMERRELLRLQDIDLVESEAATSGYKYKYSTIQLLKNALPGPNAFVGPRLLVAKIKQSLLKSIRDLDISIQLVEEKVTTQIMTSSYICSSAAERQNRRKTWAQRNSHNKIESHITVETIYHKPEEGNYDRLFESVLA